MHKGQLTSHRENSARESTCIMSSVGHQRYMRLGTDDKVEA